MAAKVGVRLKAEVKGGAFPFTGSAHWSVQNEWDECELSLALQMIPWSVWRHEDIEVCFRSFVLLRAYDVPF